MIEHINMTIASIEATAPTASKSFKDSLTFVLQHEGIYYEVINGDAGGATEAGITWQDYNAWRKEHGLLIHDLRLMTANEIVRVYTDHYWTGVHGDDLPHGLALALFDAAVNVGKGRAVQWLQAALGVHQDGAFGSGTLTAVNAYIKAHGAPALAAAVITRRTAFYNEIGAVGKTNHKFLAGWLARVADLKKAIS